MSNFQQLTAGQSHTIKGDPNGRTLTLSIVNQANERGEVTIEAGGDSTQYPINPFGNFSLGIPNQFGDVIVTDSGNSTIFVTYTS